MGFRENPGYDFVGFRMFVEEWSERFSGRKREPFSELSPTSHDRMYAVDLSTTGVQQVLLVLP